jgi:hypothetical protein
MEETFTIQEIRNYILSQDSLGDVIYYLTAKNIKQVNEDIEYNENEDDKGDDED